MSRIKITDGDFRKRKPEKAGIGNQKSLKAAMQLKALNQISFTAEDAGSKNIEFFGYIPGSGNIEFYFFEDPKMKNGNLEVHYTLANGDLGAIRMTGGSQIMFVGREAGSETFRIVARAKMDDREISFMDCTAETGKITLAFGKGADQIKEEFEARLS